VSWVGGGGPMQAHCGLPPPQALPSLQIRALRPRFAAVAYHNAALADNTASAAPGERENLPLMSLWRVRSFVRRLLVLFPRE
jgi:hypothetical protein